MLLNPQDLRKIRPIAENINDTARLEPYILEAETLRLVDAIGAGLYRWLDEDCPTTGNVREYNGKVYTKEQIDTLLDGGYYTDTCGNTKRTEGIRTAVAYVAYSRFLVNNPINPTAFGVKFKNGEFSSDVDNSTLARVSAEASKIGEAYLAKVVEYAQSIGLVPGCRKSTGAASRNLVIRQNKL